MHDRVRRAQELSSAGRVDEAEREYRAATEDEDPDAYVELAALLRDNERLSDAEAVYRSAIEAGILDVLIPFGNMLTEIPGREEEGVALYQDAIAAGDEFGHVNLAITLDRLGRADQAETEFKRAIQTSDPLARRNYGIFLYEHGRYTEAERILRDAISRGDTKAHVDLGNVLADTGRQREAEHEYQTAISEGAALTTAHKAYGLLLRELGRDEEANSHLRLSQEG